MTFPTAKLMGKTADAHTRVSPPDSHRGSCSWASFNAPEFQSRGSVKLNAIILAALDRDSELRHDHLRKRWQAVIRKSR